MYGVCELCNRRPAECTHHLIFGWDRKRADEDGLTLQLCHSCHNMSLKLSDRIHDNVAAERLSKMLGQMMFERNYIADNKCDLDEAREAFRSRYSKSFL